MTLLLKAPGLRIENFAIATYTVSLTVVSTTPSAECPACGQKTAHLHSHYQRTISDLPWAVRSVRLSLRVRRFRCADPECSRGIFAERLDRHRTLPYRIGRHGLEERAPLELLLIFEHRVEALDGGDHHSAGGVYPAVAKKPDIVLVREGVAIVGAAVLLELLDGLRPEVLAVPAERSTR